MNFGTKAQTLQYLQKSLKTANVLPSMVFQVVDWRTEKEKIWNAIKRESWSGGGKSLIVRSSALSEDTLTESNAGKYTSVLNVTGKKAFFEAVDRVIASYVNASEKEEILVQPMLSDVKICGVAFTVDPNTLGNYYVINYDETGKTDVTTSGQNGASTLYYRFKDSGYQADSRMGDLCAALSELETLFEREALDVEFAFTESGLLFIFQVRPLCLKTENIAGRKKQMYALQEIENFFIREQKEKPFIHGKKNIYGIMPDWNPAEMIGVRPKPLALSLYKELITDNIWAYQRDNYGYKNLRSFPLMLDFCGLPYIDVRVSFNSFIPQKLNSALSEKLAAYYLDRLEEEPSKHDKVEFEIVFSCYTFDIWERLQALDKYGFSDKEICEIAGSLRDLTNTIIDNKTGLWKKDYEKIKKLELRYKEIVFGDLDKISKLYWLIEDCKRYGTLPFAGLARAAFIAVQILDSLVKTNIVSQEDYQIFMQNVSTVGSDMQQDFLKLSMDEFIERYGHLRPGTYDICSKRYDEAPELYFEKEEKPCQKKVKNIEFKLSLEQLKKLRKALKEHNFTNDVLDLFEFIRTAIEGREYGKFAFTRNVSMILKLIKELGEEYDISAEDCAFINIQTIKEFYSSTWSIKDMMKDSIQRGKEHFVETAGITLPPLIVKPEDIWQFYYPSTEPNYITLKQIIAPICCITEEEKSRELVGRIVLISSADPGYDWLFSHNVAGLITKWGGANSHMAIRAGELGIPAAIGIGEKRFQKLSHSRMLKLDCASKQIEVLDGREWL